LANKYISSLYLNLLFCFSTEVHNIIAYDIVYTAKYFSDDFLILFSLKILILADPDRKLHPEF